MESPDWPVLLELAALLVLLVALAEAGIALLSRVRRYLYERDDYARSLDSFEEKLTEARIRRTVREGESISWNGFRKFRVARRQDEGGGICSFYLEAHDGKPIPAYRPGQYLTFSLRVPGESRPVVRCYSLSDAPDPATVK